MRVIWVTPSMPHPRGPGGCVHEFELISALAGRHDIHVISADIGPLDDDALRSTGVELTRVPWTLQPHPTSRARIAREVARADPNIALWLRRDRLARLEDALGAVTRAHSPDVVQVTLGEIAPLVARTEAPTALMLFDSLTREIDGRLRLERLRRRRAQLRLERRRMERFERRWYRQATGVASVSTVDAAWFSALLGRDVEVIENSVPEHLFEPLPLERSTTRVVFTGSLVHPPNEDAIEWLAAEIWPAVVERRPDAELVVVGRGDEAGAISAKLRAVLDQVGGTLHVDVDDVRPYYRQAAVSVAPIRSGAGLRSKVIHAMACGAPVVATPRALEGVPEGAARHAIAASTADRIADAVVATLDDPSGARARGEAAAAAIAPLRASAVADRLGAWWERCAR